MPSLKLVLEVADLVTDADRRLTEREVHAEAERLLEAHPEVDVAQDDLVRVIREEERAALHESW
jgi:hypothetical protein